MKINKILSILLMCAGGIIGKGAFSAPHKCTGKVEHIEYCTGEVEGIEQVEQLSITRGLLKDMHTWGNLSCYANLKVLILKQMQSVVLGPEWTPLALKRLELEAEEVAIRSPLTCDEVYMDVGVLRQSNGSPDIGEQKLSQKGYAWSQGCIGHNAVYGHIRWTGSHMTPCTELPSSVPLLPVTLPIDTGNVPISIGHIGFGKPTRIQHLTLKSRTFAAFTDGLEVGQLTLNGGTLKVAGNTKISQLTLGGESSKVVAGPWTRVWSRSGAIGHGRDHCGDSEHSQGYVGEVLITPPSRVHIGRIEGFGTLENRGGFVEVHGLVDQRKITLVQTPITPPQPVRYYQNVIRSHIAVSSGSLFGYHSAPQTLEGTLMPELICAGGLIVNDIRVLGTGRWFAPRALVVTNQGGAYKLPGDKIPALPAALKSRRDLIVASTEVSPDFGRVADQSFEDVFKEFQSTGVGSQALATYNPQTMVWSYGVAQQYRNMISALDGQRVMLGNVLFLTPVELTRYDAWNAQRQARIEAEALEKEAQRIEAQRQETLRLAREEAARQAALAAAARLEEAKRQAEEAARKVALEERTRKENEARKVALEEAKQKEARQAKAEQDRLAQAREDAERKAKEEEEAASTSRSVQLSQEGFFSFLRNYPLPRLQNESITLASTGEGFKAINIGVLSDVPVNIQGQFEAAEDIMIQAPEVNMRSKVHSTSSHHQDGEGGSYSITRQTLEKTSLKAERIAINADHMKTTAVDIRTPELNFSAKTWHDQGAQTTTSDRRVVAGKKEDAVYTGSTTAFNASTVDVGTLNMRVRDVALEGAKVEAKDGGVVQVKTLVQVAGRSGSTETASNQYIQSQQYSNTAVSGLIKGPVVQEEFPEQLLIQAQTAVFQGTQFKGNVEVNASQKMALLAAVNTDGYEKREVLKDSKILQKTQEHQGRGISYTDCKVEGKLTVDTPHLTIEEVARPGGLGREAAPGSRNLEITPRDEFTEVRHTLENRIEARSGPIQKSLKPAFKAALSVGVAALSVGTGGFGAGIGAMLATTALTSSATSFITRGGLEAVMNHEAIHVKDILKDVGKSLAVAGLTQGLSAGLTELTSSAVSEHIISKIALKSLAHYGVHRQNLVQTVAGQGISELAALGAGQIGQSYQDKDLNWASHKLIHGALAMASTMSYGALNQDMNWTTALVAAGAVMGAESAGEAWSQVLKDQSLPPQDGESKEDYIQRTQAYAQDWGQRSAACLRVLSASSLVLAGKGEATILAADLATDTALEHNFMLMTTAVTADVAQGYLDVKEAWEEGNYWSVAGYTAFTGACVGLDIATQGVGTQAVKMAYRGAKVGLRVGRRIVRGPVKPKAPNNGQVLKHEGKAPEESVQTRSQVKGELGKLEAAQNPERKNLTRRKQHDEKHQDPKAQKLGTRFKDLKKEERVENFRKDHTKHDTGFVEEVKLPDGRIRKYGKELPGTESNPAVRGSRMEAEYNPRTGNYKETTVQLDHNGQVIRTHPAFRNGANIKKQTPHYPATSGDFQEKNLKNFKHIVEGKEVPLLPKVGDHLLDNNKYPAGTVPLPKKPEDLGGKR